MGQRRNKNGPKCDRIRLGAIATKSRGRVLLLSKREGSTDERMYQLPQQHIINAQQQMEEGIRRLVRILHIVGALAEGNPEDAARLADRCARSPRHLWKMLPVIGRARPLRPLPDLRDQELRMQQYDFVHIEGNTHVYAEPVFLRAMATRTYELGLLEVEPMRFDRFVLPPRTDVLHPVTLRILERAGHL